MRIAKPSLVLILTGALCGACVVPQAQYDELSQQHALEKQKSTRLSQQLEDLGKQLAETRASLEKTEVRLSGSEQELVKKQASLENNSQSLAEVEYEKSVKETEKQAAEGMVTQLREELTRIAGHIATLSAAKDQLRDERDKLLTEVSSLTARVKVLEAETAAARWRTELVRDLTLKLAEPMRAATLTLTPQPNHIELRMPASAVFDAKSGAISADGRTLLGRIGKALAASAVQVQVSELAAQKTVSEREAHIRQVAGELHAAGTALEQLNMRDDPSRSSSAASKKPESEIVLRLTQAKPAVAGAAAAEVKKQASAR